jgi:hypothetical protein
VLLSSLAEALFLLLICSYTILEVWTQEPLRQLDGPEGPTDAAAYALARRRVGRHLLLNLGLFLLVLVLWAGAGVLAPCHSS